MLSTRVLSTACLLVLLLSAGAPVYVRAMPQTKLGQTLNVTKFTDSADGVCDADCSLREAIEAANQTLGADTITLGAGTYELTIPPSQGGETIPDDIDNTVSDLDIQGQLVLLGAGADKTVIMSKMRDRVLEVLADANATLQALAITGGNCDNDGGGIANAGKLILRDVAVFANRNGSYDMGGDGGGIINLIGGDLAIYSSRIVNNIADPGGSIGASGGGVANGGTAQIFDSLIQENRTVGSENISIGGGVVNSGRALISRSAIISNATDTSGGGISNIDGGNLQVVNSTVSGNAALSGSAHPEEGAGGIGNGRYGVNRGGDVDLVNVTVSGNTGSGLFNSLRMTVTNSIIAGNFKLPFTVATCSNTGTFNTLGANVFDDESACSIQPTGNYIVDNDAVFTSTLSVLGDHGGPTPSHIPLPGSVLIDTADDNDCFVPPVDSLDQRGVERPQGAHCDIGAVEREQREGYNLIYVSSTSSVVVNRGKDEIRANDEDILRYDTATAKWVMVFDGSDVGITVDVDAFEFLADGSILLSLDASAKLAGVGKVDDADIVQFIPTQLGTTTQGTFKLWLDGATVGLKSGTENIDVIAFTTDSRLLISTSNQFNVANLKGRDEDLFVLNPTAAGMPNGTWAMYLDGSDVGLSTGRDVNGAWVDPLTGEIYLSTNGPYHVAGLSGDEDDIFICTPIATGPDSQCTFRLFWDGDTAGFGGERLDGIAIGDASHALAINKLDDTRFDGQPERLEPTDDGEWIEETEDDMVFMPIVTD